MSPIVQSSPSPKGASEVSNGIVSVISGEQSIWRHSNCLINIVEGSIEYRGIPGMIRNNCKRFVRAERSRLGHSECGTTRQKCHIPLFLGISNKKLRWIFDKN